MVAIILSEKWKAIRPYPTESLSTPETEEKHLTNARPVLKVIKTIIMIQIQMCSLSTQSYQLSVQCITCRAAVASKTVRKEYNNCMALQRTYYQDLFSVSGVCFSSTYRASCKFWNLCTKLSRTLYQKLSSRYRFNNKYWRNYLANFNESFTPCTAQCGWFVQRKYL